MSAKKEVLETIKRSTPVILPYVHNQNPDLSKEKIYEIINVLIEEGKIELSAGRNTADNFSSIAVKRI